MPAGRRIQGYSVGWSSMPEAGSILPAVNGGEHSKIQMVEAFVSVASQGNQVSGTWAIHECQQWLRDLHKVRGTRCLPSSVQLHSMLLRFSCCCTSKVLMKLLVASFFFFWSSGKSLGLSCLQQNTLSQRKCLEVYTPSNQH